MLLFLFCVVYYYRKSACTAELFILSSVFFQMESLSKLLASRRIPGEHASKKVDPALLSNEIKPEETAEEVGMMLASLISFR